MASKATRQAIAIISVIHGAIRVLINEKRFSRLDMREELEAFNRQVSDIRDRYAPDYGPKDINWTLDRLDRWGEDMAAMELPGHLHTPVLVKVAAMALEDLQSKVRYRDRKEMLDSLSGVLEKLHDFVDPDGAKFTAFETADKVLHGLYDLIGFQP